MWNEHRDNSLLARPGSIRVLVGLRFTPKALSKSVSAFGYSGQAPIRTSAQPKILIALKTPPRNRQSLLCSEKIEGHIHFVTFCVSPNPKIRISN